MAAVFSCLYRAQASSHLGLLSRTGKMEEDIGSVQHSQEVLWFLSDAR